MDLVEFMRDYASKIEGQFSDYDSNKSIVVVPVDQGRFQTVIGRKKEEQHNRVFVEISSKICRLRESLNLTDLLVENSNLQYSKFSILDDYLKVEATINMEVATPKIIEEMIQEVAESADHWEQRLAGVDVH